MGMEIEGRVWVVGSYGSMCWFRLNFLNFMAGWQAGWGERVVGNGSQTGRSEMTRKRE